MRWADLRHAYGSAGDVPAMLRRAGSGGDDGRAAIGDLHGTIFHQGTVYPATTPAVPFLVQLARSAPDHRDQLIWMLGMLADPHHAYGDDFSAVRAAVAVHAGDFARLLADADVQVREAAAYAFAQCAAAAAPLWDRWATEEQPAVRASLLLALAMRDPARSAPVMAEAVLGDPPVVRVAAAVALIRNRVAWPDGAIAAVVSAVDDGVRVNWVWSSDHDDWSDELLLGDDALAAAVLARLLDSPRAETRRVGLRGMVARGHARRSAPGRLLPLVRPLLDDPDQDVREAVFEALRESGTASGQFAAEIAVMAARYPQTAGRVAITAEYEAMETLMLLGDPRWIEPVCAAATQGHLRKTRQLLRPGPRWDPHVFEPVRGQLGQLAATGAAHPALPLLAEVLGQWGSAAAGAAPELLAALPLVGETAALALLRIGHRGQEMLPFLRALTEGAAHEEAATGVWWLTGDPGPLVAALRARLTSEWAGVPAAPVVAELGSALLPLVAVAQAQLTGEAAGSYQERDVRLLAARVLSAATGDPAPAVPTIRAVLVAGGPPAHRAAALVGDLATTQPAAVSELEPVLRDLLTERWARVTAARALWRLGVPPAELVAPLIAAIAAGYWSHGALPLLTDMQASEAIPDLERLASQAERISAGNSYANLIWEDELLQTQLQATIAALRTTWHR